MLSKIQGALKEAMGRLILQPEALRESHVSNKILEFMAPHRSSKILIILKLQPFLNKMFKLFSCIKQIPMCLVLLKKQTPLLKKLLYLEVRSTFYKNTVRNCIWDRAFLPPLYHTLIAYQGDLSFGRITWLVLNIALHLPLNGSEGAVAFREGNYFCFPQPEFAKPGKAGLPLCFAIFLYPW